MARVVQWPVAFSLSQSDDNLKDRASFQASDAAAFGCRIVISRGWTDLHSLHLLPLHLRELSGRIASPDLGGGKLCLELHIFGLKHERGSRNCRLLLCDIALRSSTALRAAARTSFRLYRSRSST